MRIPLDLYYLAFFRACSFSSFSLSSDSFAVDSAAAAAADHTLERLLELPLLFCYSVAKQQLTRGSGKNWLANRLFNCIECAIIRRLCRSRSSEEGDVVDDGFKPKLALEMRRREREREREKSRRKEYGRERKRERQHVTDRTATKLGAKCTLGALLFTRH